MSLITIGAADVKEWHGEAVPTEARLRANRRFTTSEGIIILPGNDLNPDAFQSFDLTLSSTNVRIEAGDAYASDNSLDHPESTYNLDAYDADGNWLFNIYSSIRISSALSPTTWDAIRAFSSGIYTKYPSTYLSSAAILALLGQIVSGALKASSTQQGVLKLDVDAVDLNNPIALGPNSPVLAALAPLVSPHLTGLPTAPTAAPGTNNTQIATTAYADAIAALIATALALKANLASPALTGTPTAPTASPGTNNTQIATTAYADAASGSGQSVAFNTAIPFSSLSTKMANHTMSADLTFTVDTAGQIDLAVTSLRLLGDGSHDITFTGIKIASGSGSFVTTNGIVNVLLFFFDGTDHWVNIFQEAVFPTLVSATVEDADPDKIVLTYNKSLDAGSVPVVGDYSPSGGRTVTNVAIVGAVVTLTVDTPYAFGDTITISYTAGTNPIQDADGNEVVNLVAESVTNNVVVSEVAIHPDLSSSTVTFFDIDLSSGTWKGTSAVSVWNHWAQCLEKLPASTDGYVEIEPGVGSSAIGLMDLDNAGNYTQFDFGGFNSGGTFWRASTGGSVADTGVAYAAGDKLRIKRVAGTVSLVRVRGGIETNALTFSGTHNGALFIGFAIASQNDTFILPKGFGVVTK